MREIVRQIVRAPSTIYRELRHNALMRAGDFVYRAPTAEWHADGTARRPKMARFAAHDALRSYMADRLAGNVIAPSGRTVAGPAVR